MFPLRSQSETAVDYLLLGDALAAKLVTVREVSEAGSVSDLIVDNRADKPVLVVDGEELVGAKQNRVANLTLLVAAGRTTSVPGLLRRTGTLVASAQSVRAVQARASTRVDGRRSYPAYKRRCASKARVIPTNWPSGVKSATRQGRWTRTRRRAPWVLSSNGMHRPLMRSWDISQHNRRYAAASSRLAIRFAGSTCSTSQRHSPRFCRSSCEVMA